jgi:myo-inositol-1(or 4)-monophosphatase
MGDVVAGSIVEIKSGGAFHAERGGGLDPQPRLSANADLSRMFWTYGLRGRPARPTIEVLAELIDASSVGGSTFDLGSATYDMTRIATGQLDAYVEPGPRIVADVPGMRAEFERVGGGAVLNNSPYDLAAALLCLEEAGAVVTDAYGESLRDRPLLGSGEEFQMSCVAAANAELHARILAEVEAGIGRLVAAA